MMNTKVLAPLRAVFRARPALFRAQPALVSLAARCSALSCGLVLAAVLAASAQEYTPERVPVLTRHSGVIRMQSWNKGFVFDRWVDPRHKSVTVGVGDWIELAGSGAQADVVWPDLTTILMRKAAEIQILKLGGQEHEIALLNGVSVDVTLCETAATLRLPGDRALRWRGGKRAKVDLMIQFDAHFDRIRVRHARGETIEVLRHGRVVRMLESGQRLDLEVELPEPVSAGAVHELSRRYAFELAGRRIEIPPGTLYRIEPNRVFLRRDSTLGAEFGVLRIDEEALVVGPGTELEVVLPPEGA
ncbi:MAG: hypothetical protein JXQ29_14090 [Planctomycetes bacterium]|nr:hypothetical protein [Planctomycetota bacterium]